MDLAQALKTGHIKAAALDVHQQEPYDPNSGMSALSLLPNVIHTPHCSWFSETSARDLRVNAAKEVRCP